MRGQMRISGLLSKNRSACLVPVESSSVSVRTLIFHKVNILFSWNLSCRYLERRPEVVFLVPVELFILNNIHSFFSHFSSIQYCKRCYFFISHLVTQGTSLDQECLSVLRGFWRMQAQWACPSSCGSALASSRPLVRSAMQS